MTAGYRVGETMLRPERAQAIASELARAGAITVEVTTLRNGPGLFGGPLVARLHVTVCQTGVDLMDVGGVLRLLADVAARERMDVRTTSQYRFELVPK